MPDQKFTNVLEWKAGSTAAAVQANKAVEASVQSVAAASSSVALRFNSVAEAQKALGLSNAQMGITEAAITTEKTAQLAITERLAAAEKVRASAVEEVGIAELRNAVAISASEAADNTASIARGLRNARAAAIALPGVGFQSPLPVGLRGAEIAVSNIGVGTTAAFGLAGAAIAATLLIVTESMRKTEEAAKSYSAAQLDLAKLLGSGATTADVQKRIDDIKGEQDALNAFYVTLTNLQTNLQGAFNIEAVSPEQNTVRNALIASAQEELKTATNGLITNLDGLEIALGANDTRVKELGAAALVLEASLSSASVAAADAAENAEHLKEVNADLNQQFVDYQLAGAAKLLAADQLTSAEREKRIRLIDYERESLVSLIAEEGTNSETRVQLRIQLAGLTQDYDALNTITRSYADILEREAAAKQALTDRNDQYIDAVDREVEANEKAFAIQTKIADIVADRDSKLAEQQADYYDRRADVQTTANEKSLEDTATAEARRQKIIRDAGRSFDEAVGTRDANAYRLANIRASDALADANADANKAVETTAKAQVKQLAALDKGYEKQVQSTRTAAANQLAVQQGLLAEQQFLAQTSATSQAFIVASGLRAVENEFAGSMARLAVIAGSASNGMSGNRLTGVGSQFPTLSSTYPGGPSQQFNQRFDTRFAQTIRGGRTITQ